MEETEVRPRQMRYQLVRRSWGITGKHQRIKVSMHLSHGSHHRAANKDGGSLKVAPFGYTDPFTALTWALQMGEISRFPSIKQAISYCGLWGDSLRECFQVDSRSH